ncbi:MAG TPA: hypothetical protein PKH79_15230 [Prolixibacteraceae bacterium]|nr:hypothetical protein [Prolixibacteraceae bacterium]
MIFNGKIKTQDKDTGLRGNYNGELYVDKKVFYQRAEVKAVVDSLKKSGLVRGVGGNKNANR